ncbi:DUF7151 family protein [Flagellimonas sp.]|uniref:DUF7151 family protein n=1 Tax=Flagellimonas sp. TaxID=2058762 RepID=UPI003AB65394
MKNKLIIIPSVILTIALLQGCEGEQGPQGESGLNNLVKLSTETAGSNCGNGGVKVELGLDSNSDGTLGPNEVLTTNYICTGEDGLVSLTDVVVEPIGANCSNGGFRINSGLDINLNGTLEESEVSANAFICNGLNGGNSLVRTTNESPGINCSKGGIKIDAGIDLNGNGSLDEEEITSSDYLCNGEDGDLSLVNITEVPANLECPNGGFLFDSGLDTNGDGILDDFEILSTRNICNGLDGMFNEEIRLVFFSGTLGSSHGTNSTDGFTLSVLQKFDIRRYNLVQSVIFKSRSWTSDSGTTSFVELINEDTGEVIPNSTLSTNDSGFGGDVLTSPNIYADLPQEEITLGLRIRSENNGVSVYVTGRSELILNRGNL